MIVGEILGESGVILGEILSSSYPPISTDVLTLSFKDDAGLGSTRYSGPGDPPWKRPVF